MNWVFVVCEVIMSEASHIKANFICFLSMIAIFSSGFETIILVGGEIFEAIKSDSFGDMVCSLADPNEILNVRSKPVCILAMSGRSEMFRCELEGTRQV